MILVAVLTILFNIILYIVSTQLLAHMSVLIFVLLIYLAPLIINGILTLLMRHQNLEKSTIISATFFPTISIITYWLLGNALDGTKKWMSFVANNSVSTGDTYVKINPHLTSISQMIFVIILYFSIEFLLLTIIKKLRGTHHENN